uniref:Uncharacterized protein n=1 Tax=Octopus bimaculoides TaxID=37653 RepID=A0A0L8HCN2_OCTBM
MKSYRNCLFPSIFPFHAFCNQRKPLSQQQAKPEQLQKVNSFRVFDFQRLSFFKKIGYNFCCRLFTSSLFGSY